MADQLSRNEISMLHLRQAAQSDKALATWVLWADASTGKALVEDVAARQAERIAELEAQLGKSASAGVTPEALRVVDNPKAQLSD